MNILLVAAMLLSTQSGAAVEKYEDQSEQTIEIDARFIPIISDSGKRFSKSGYSLSEHVVQIRTKGPVVYIDYIYNSGQSRGGSTGACCVSITYEYVAGKFSKSYFAR